MKRVGIILCVVMALLMCSCSSESEENVDNVDNVAVELEEFVVNNIGYDLDEILIIDQYLNDNNELVKYEEGLYAISVSVGTQYKMSEFTTIAEKLVHVSEMVEDEINVTIMYVSLSLYTGDDEWVKWYSDTGNLYNQHDFINSDVSLEDLPSEIEELLPPEEKFGDAITPYQGEWGNVNDSDETVIISGDEVNFVEETKSSTKQYRHIDTIYFGFDDNGRLILTKSNGEAVYNISITEDGFLLMQDIVNEYKTTTYEKISDNTTVPERREEPKIGMTKSEVRESTWGSPKKINTTETEYGSTEQWVYSEGYIYFRGGVVSSIQK